ncbi:AAA family ATPase [Ammoniphilus sp. YIM 78166]|uniref:AAA family ATPase n=1 Tax=Ammoniphilus sp. YIM 78166 TaxID=1644106 RepID=UPI00106FB9FF|nr:AAA family ATPase [Ammoniphilus sp. YIM 78166]
MKWIQRVIIEDFQSHRLTELELVEGFNVIVGPSDQGKTAVLRAIRWVLYNEPKGNDFIRVGSNKAKVTLVMNDGTIVSRERTSSRNRYAVAVPGMEEQVYEGFGHTVPEEVMEATGVRLLKMDEDHQVPINIGMQLDSPFLLESNGSIKAKAIGRINGVHILDYAHKTTSSELNSKQMEERRILAEIEKREEQLQLYEDLDQWEKDLVQVEQKLKQVQDLDARSQWLRDKQEMRKEIVKKLLTAEDFLKKLETLDLAAAKWQRAEVVERAVNQLELMQGQQREIEKSLEAARRWIMQTVQLPEAEGKLEQALSLQNQEQAMQKLKQTETALKKESLEITRVLEGTCHLTQADQTYHQVLEVDKQEQKLVALHQKSLEYQDVSRKIGLVVRKTEHLEKAQALWQTWEDHERHADRLQGYSIKKQELSRQLRQVDLYLLESEALEHAGGTWEKAMAYERKINELLTHHARLYAMREESQKLNVEIQETDALLEGWAKQYYEQLKTLGRCPICLGEIEQHTVERIVSEIS